MEVLKLMKKRCSVRKFEDRAIEEEKLLYVLEAARVAPSACNFQPWRFIVVKNKDLMKRIAPAWVADANTPAMIVICGDHRQAWRRRDGKDHCDIDIAIAVDHMTLAAAEVSLGTCWICSFDAFQCTIALELPDQVEPMVLLPIGYPAESREANRHDRDRKPLEEIVSWID
ncbi:MAG: nitroreductase family protein [Planctomycetes bacterium]|nr:nitroreductase family protein [Planctomycetota bacterium]MBL7042263.1 nitroreductase family protein [Pirellulaceae bacterium]